MANYAVIRFGNVQTQQVTTLPVKIFKIDINAFSVILPEIFVGMLNATVILEQLIFSIRLGMIKQLTTIPWQIIATRKIRICFESSMRWACTVTQQIIAFDTPGVVVCTLPK